MRGVPRMERGFTLAEMTVVAVILAVLAGVAMPLAKIAVQREKEISLHRELRSIRSAIDADGGVFERQYVTRLYIARRSAAGG